MGMTPHWNLPMVSHYTTPSIKLSVTVYSPAICCDAGAYTGGFTVANEPPRSFKFRFKINGICRMRAHCVPARFRGDRSRGPAVFHRMHMRHSFNFQASDRCRARKTMWQANPADCAVYARSSVRVISVQNGEHSFCSKRRYDEEKCFNGHSFLPAKRGASSAEPPFFLVAWHTGKESVKETLLPRLINIVVVRRQEHFGLLRTDRPPLRETSEKLSNAFTGRREESSLRFTACYDVYAWSPDAGSGVRAEWQ